MKTSTTAVSLAILIMVLVHCFSLNIAAQETSFEVATIKPAPPDDRGGRYLTMQGGHQFIAKNYSLKYMVAAAYNLNPRAVSGGPDWTDSVRFDIRAVTPGETRPSLDQQMSMLRKLLTDRFGLKFHTEPKEFSVYTLVISKNGPTLKESSASPDEQPMLINTVFPGEKIRLPARNATMSQFASMLQRGVLDRPVVDKTGLSARYDFDLEWTPDDTQFGGNLPPVPPENVKLPDLFAALQQQLGLKLESARAPVDTIVIDSVQPPAEN
jgi:uncharacterized protein (TIGR03435 family)